MTDNTVRPRAPRVPAVPRSTPATEARVRTPAASTTPAVTRPRDGYDRNATRNPTPVGANDMQPVAPAATGPALHVNVPYYSQFEGGHGYTPGNTACLRAASAMVGAANATMLQGSNNRIQTGLAETPGGITLDRQGAERGREYIDQQLALNRPVVVGVNHQPGSGNADNITDHFVVVTGRGVDEQGRTYYTFHDPGTRNADRGRDTNPNNRLYLDPQTGGLSRPGDPTARSVTDRTYDVAMVRLNAP